MASRREWSEPDIASLHQYPGSHAVNSRILRNTQMAPGIPGMIDVAVPGMNERVRADMPRCMQKAAAQLSTRALVMKRSGFGAGFLVRVRGSDYGKKVFEGAA